MNLYHFEQLLEQYRLLWNNRQLSLSSESAEIILLEAIKRELLDENSHPRIRRSKYDKFYFSTKRITESEIEDGVKLRLIQLHIKVLDEL